MSALSPPEGGSAPAPTDAIAATSLLAPPLHRRMACWVYESMLLFGVVFSAALLFSIVGQMRHGMDPRQPLFQAFLFVVCGAYCTWFWSHGQTLAMRAWQIQVVDRNGLPLRQWRALFRYLCAWIWVLPPLAVLKSFSLGGTGTTVVVMAWVTVWALLSRLHPQRQFLHDAIAGTRLIPGEGPGKT